jgi:hypothetical protein
LFIRFISGEIDEYSHVPAGLFSAALDLLWSDELPPYEVETLKEVKEWFDRHMASPFDCLAYNARYDPAICWFKSTARGHLARAWEMVAILERNDIMIWTIRSPRVGYVHYEDDAGICPALRLHEATLTLTPKAFANFSPAVGAKRQPWDRNNKKAN